MTLNVSTTPTPPPPPLKNTIDAYTIGSSTGYPGFGTLSCIAGNTLDVLSYFGFGPAAPAPSPPAP